MRTDKMESPSCTRCRFYYMTWKTEQPHGCRAFGFTSKALPTRVVLESSGKPCGYFEAKPKPRKTKIDKPLW